MVGHWEDQIIGCKRVRQTKKIGRGNVRDTGTASGRFFTDHDCPTDNIVWQVVVKKWPDEIPGIS
jgi:hypothetical protein